MEVKDYKQTVCTSDVVHVYDEENNLNWFVVFEKTNGIWQGGREAMNYDLFKKQGANYMQKVYDIAYKHVHK